MPKLTKKTLEWALHQHQQRLKSFGCLWKTVSWHARFFCPAVLDAREMEQINRECCHYFWTTNARSDSVITQQLIPHLKSHVIQSVCHKKPHKASHKCITSYEDRWKEIFWFKGFFVCVSPFLMQRQRCIDGWIWREFVGEADRWILALCVQSRRIVHGCFAALWEASDKRNEQLPFCGRNDRGNNKVLYCWDVICWLLKDGPQKHLTGPVLQEKLKTLHVSYEVFYHWPWCLLCKVSSS